MKDSTGPTRKPRGARATSPQGPISLEELNRRLLAAGLVTRLPDPPQDTDDDDEPLIVIEGEPLSETIICERR